MSGLQKHKQSSDNEFQTQMSGFIYEEARERAPVFISAGRREHASAPAETTDGNTMQRVPEEMLLSQTPPSVPMAMAAARPFDDRLAEVSGKIATSLLSAETDIKDRKLRGHLQKTMTKFQEFSEIRGEGKFDEIDKKGKETWKAIRKIRSALEKMKQERDALISRMRALTFEEIKKSTEATNRIHELNQLIEKAEQLLQPFLSFMNYDIYGGALETKDEITVKDKEIKPGPALADDGKGTEYVFKDVRDLPLFAHPPCPDDIYQGKLGDCYLLAGLAAAARADASLITRAMKDMGDYVCVQFYRAPQHPDKTKIIRVQKTVPVKREKGETGNITSEEDAYAKNFLWVQMMEKAYMASGLRAGTKKTRSSKKEYGDIEKGQESIFLAQLTGKTSTVNVLTLDTRMDPSNSLIGVYAKLFTPTVGATFSEDTKQLMSICSITTEIPVNVMETAARVIQEQHADVGISADDAANIVMGMALEQYSRESVYLDQDTVTKGLAEKVKISRPANLDDLIQILNQPSVLVADSHVPGSIFRKSRRAAAGHAAPSADYAEELDSFAEQLNIAITDLKEEPKEEIEQPKEEIEQPKEEEEQPKEEEEKPKEVEGPKEEEEEPKEKEEKPKEKEEQPREEEEQPKEDEKKPEENLLELPKCTPQQWILADRIRTSYHDRKKDITIKDAIYMAINYEAEYRTYLAEKMMDKLEKMNNMPLAYSPFYIKKGGKKGYSAKANQVYNDIRSAIMQRKSLTAVSADLNHEGDKTEIDGI